MAVRSPSRRQPHRVPAALIVAVAGCFFASAALAAKFNYVFSGASTVLNGTKESITGSFTFIGTHNPSADAVTSAHIELSGPPPYAGKYVYNKKSYVTDSVVAYNYTRGISIDINFPGLGSNGLGTSPVPLSVVEVAGKITTGYDSSPTGFAVFATPASR
jgi:hypothetical protein